MIGEVYGIWAVSWVRVMYERLSAAEQLEDDRENDADHDAGHYGEIDGGGSGVVNNVAG
jgi:hypothetical protein